MSYLRKECLFCGPTASLQALYPQTFRDQDLTPAVFSARRVTEHFHYAMVRCQGCGLVFSRDVLSDEVLLELYADSQVTFGQYTDVLRADYWRPLERWAAALSHLRALEIGCSSGFFLDELHRRGWSELVGYEPSRAAIEQASETVRPSIRQGFFGPDAGGSFDLACSFHVLDHVSDPRAVVQSCRDHLVPGGLIYLVTHDVEALQARLLGEKSPIVDIEHIYLFSKTTLGRLLAECDFEVLEVSDLANSYPLSYWVRMAPLPRLLKRAILALLRVCGLSERRWPVRAGNIYAIGRVR